MGHKKGEVLKTAFDSFTIQRQVGAGGAGEVYEVRDSDNSLYAAKILDTSKTSTVRLKRFKNEIHFCTKNTYRNIIRVLGSGVTAEGATFYIMPLFSGTLRDLVSKGIAQQSVLTYFGQILDGVETAHLHGVWHRDLKPENILYSAPDNLLVVADFGVAHFEEEGLLTAVETRNDDRLANFLYSAPEQRRRNQSVDSKADVYALGLILNEMYTGRVPQGTGFRQISEVCADYAYLDGLVDQMMRDDSSLRPSVTEVKRELIARGSQFLSVQRLNSLKSEVIPETEVDDPIVRNPILLNAVDYQDGMLVFTLNAAPTQNWIREFQNPATSFSYYPGAEPGTFSFLRNQARVQLGPGMQPQQLVIYTKSYIELANKQYRDRLTVEHLDKVANEREQLRNRIAEEERRQKILAEIKI